MSDETLKPSEFEQLSAYMDGELPAPEAEQVAARIAADPAWAAAAEELTRLDALLDAWQTPPLRRDLSGLVTARAAQPTGLPNWFRLLAPLATAAAIVLSVWSYHTFFRPADEVAPVAQAPQRSAQDPLEARVAKVIGDLPEKDHFAVENLDMWEDYEVLSNFATLEALEKLEADAGGDDS